jgi:hypothetical protein
MDGRAAWYHDAIMGRWCLLLVVVAASFVFAGCSSERDRQWYKPGVNYTVAEFTRDRDECTQGRVLDEQCMKQRGWFPLTSDRSPESGPPKPNTRGPKY